jgi:hypothetical protein
VCIGGTCRASWAESFGGAGNEYVEGVATDANGNVYVAGFFDGPANFGGAVLAPAGATDVFVASYTADGAHRWSRRFGGTSGDVATRIAVDLAGNVYVVGSFAGAADFGPGTLMSAGGSDAFVLSLDASGATRWVRRYGGAGSEQATAAAADVGGGVVFALPFNGSVDFGTGPLVSAGLNDIGLVSLDANGLARWAQRYGSTGSEQPFGMAEDLAGDVYVIGAFTGTSDLGGGAATAVGANDVFVAHYESTTGAHVWSRRFGSAGNDQGFDVGLDAAGNVFAVGTCGGSIDFGTGPLACASPQDGFVAALTAAGTARWVDRIGGTGVEFPYRTVVTTAGDVAVAGYFSGTTDLGMGSVTVSGTAGFVAAYANASGAARWTRADGGTAGNVNFIAVAAEAHGGLVLGGTFSGAQNFVGTTLTSAGGYDALLMTLYP